MAYGPKQRQSVSASLRHTANGKGRQSRRRRGNCISVYTPLKHTFVCLAARAGGRPFQLISAYNGAICKSADFLSYPGRRVAAPRWGAVFAAAGQDTVRGKKLRRYTPAGDARYHTPCRFYNVCDSPNPKKLQRRSIHEAVARRQGPRACAAYAGAARRNRAPPTL